MQDVELEEDSTETLLSRPLLTKAEVSEILSAMETARKNQHPFTATLARGIEKLKALLAQDGKWESLKERLSK